MFPGGDFVDLTYIQRSGPDEDAWWVTLPPEQGGERASFRDADAGGLLPSLLEALSWHADRTGGRREWAWVEEGLERVDRGGTHGWWASVDLGSHLDADLFEDVDHGGPREALVAALAWRRRVARPGGDGGGGGRPPRSSGTPRKAWKGSSPVSGR